FGRDDLVGIDIVVKFVDLSSYHIPFDTDSHGFLTPACRKQGLARTIKVVSIVGELWVVSRAVSCEDGEI
ncbi:MAG: hypothetical protein ACOY3D_00235, partial [Candidatus Omnitrophota bacterium]